MTVFAHGETLTRLRWWGWADDGTGDGYPDERTLPGVALAPATDPSDLAGRRGHIQPAAVVLSLGKPALDVQPHDLLRRRDDTLWAVTSAPQRWTHPMTGRAMGATADLVELVDTGPHTITVYGSETVIDSYGTPTRRPVTEGLEVAGVTVEPVTPPGSGETTGAGQSAPGTYRVTGRRIPLLDAYSVIDWAGRRFDVIGTPVRWPWPPENPYTQATLRERT